MWLAAFAKSPLTLGGAGEQDPNKTTAKKLAKFLLIPLYDAGILSSM